MNRLSSHLNKLRWLSLSSVFMLLVFIPFASIYQNYHAAHAYDLLNSQEKTLYDFMEFITDPFVSDPAELDAVKGTTWSANIFGFKISDPLAVVSQSAAKRSIIYTPFVLTALVPLIITLILGRVFCGWICPATLLYELNTNFGLLLNKLGLPVYQWQLNRRIKYYGLFLGIFLAFSFGLTILPAVYPPAIIGREIYYAIALDGFSTSAIFFLCTMMFDIFIARRGFCRYLCPGGALYSLISHYRLLRIRREVTQCNDCHRCNSICEFGLQPMQDQFGPECSNCCACIATCPSGALKFTISTTDQPYQGAGHHGRRFRTQENIPKLITTDRYCG